MADIVIFTEMSECLHSSAWHNAES